MRKRIFFVALTLLGVACARKDAPPSAASITDDFGDTIVVGPRPTRIVSLNPATTEIMFAIGAGDRLVGRTHWDLYPAAAARVPDLGTGIRPNIEAVLGARPQLVLLYASTDNRNAAQRFRAAGVNTLSIKTDRIESFFRATQLIGRLVGDTAQATVVADSVRKSIESVRAKTSGLPKPTVFWHIWDAPLITIGRGSYMNELIEIAGGKNVYGDLDQPSPQVGIEDVFRRDPDYIITGPEGVKDLSSDPKWIPLRAVRDKKILVVDTAIVGRPSVRLGEAALSIAKLLHPAEIH